MQSLGIRATGMMPDVTINMFSTPPAIDSESRNGIGFSFRVDKDATTRDPITRLIKQVCERTSPDDELVFVGQVGRDVTFMRELAAVAEQIRPGQVHFLDCHTDIDSAFSAYRGCRAVLSNRLHALLPALKEGASPIALTVPELDPKITGVFESIGLSERVLDIRSAEMDEVVRFMAPMTFDGSAAAKDLNYFFDELLETTVNGVRPQRAAKN
jgi:polysaccharide pyruvyl transferase WcaK-like protein